MSVGSDTFRDILCIYRPGTGTFRGGSCRMLGLGNQTDICIDISVADIYLDCLYRMSGRCIELGKVPLDLGSCRRRGTHLGCFYKMQGPCTWVGTPLQRSYKPRRDTRQDCSHRMSGQRIWTDTYSYTAGRGIFQHCSDNTSDLRTRPDMAEYKCTVKVDTCPGCSCKTSDRSCTGVGTRPEGTQDKTDGSTYPGCSCKTSDRSYTGVGTRPEGTQDKTDGNTYPGCSCNKPGYCIRMGIVGIRNIWKDTC